MNSGSEISWLYAFYVGREAGQRRPSRESFAQRYRSDGQRNRRGYHRASVSLNLAELRVLSKPGESGDLTNALTSCESSHHDPRAYAELERPSRRETALPSVLIHLRLNTVESPIC